MNTDFDARREALVRQLVLVDAEEHAHKKYEKELSELFSLGDGAVLRFDRCFILGGRGRADQEKWYTYVAIRAAGGWYLSGYGNENAKIYSGELKRLLTNEVIRNVQVVNEWRRLGS